MTERRRGLCVLTNTRLEPRINWSTLGPPVARALVAQAGAAVIAPPPIRGHGAELRAALAEVRSARSVFWMQLAVRPETPVLLSALGAGRVRRSAYVLDAWPYHLRKLSVFARAARLRPCFIAMREAFEELVVLAPGVPFVHLPFGADLDVFTPGDGDRDIFAFSMGRLHEPIHAALRDYCAQRNLNYVVSQGGAITDPAELGRLVGRAKYFVVTPPDLDHPERAGRFSPLVMRYLEGLAGGARLLGTLPRSGEFESMLPRESILEVAADGSDLARRLDDDARDDSGFAASAVATAIVRAEHGWQHRATTIADVLAAS